MKRFLYLIFVLVCTVHLSAQNILPKPNPPRLVVDAAGLLSPDQQNILEQKLDRFNDTTSNQIAVVTVNDLDGDDVEDYANKLFRSWGIGGTKHNNGVLLLISKGDRKFRIEVGYGLEGAITDVLSNDILENDLTPNFKNGDYYAGIDEAVNSLEKAAAGEYKERGTQNSADGKGGNVLGIIIFIIVIIIAITRGRWWPRWWYDKSQRFWRLVVAGNVFGWRQLGKKQWRLGRRFWRWWIWRRRGGFGGFGGGSSGGGGASGGW